MQLTRRAKIVRHLLIMGDGMTWNEDPGTGMCSGPGEFETHAVFVHARADRAPIREPGPKPPMKDPRAPKPIEEPDPDPTPIQEPGVEVPRIEPPDQEQPPMIEPPEPTGVAKG